MNVTAERTVRDVARENPVAPRVFEKFGIDYCCQGDRPLSEACRTANLAIDSVLDALEMAELAAHSLEKQRNWSDETLTDLICHIQKTHHRYTRDELARIAPLLDKVCGVHGKNHPELLEIRQTFQALSQELTTHLMKEEMILFPYLIRMEESIIAKEPVVPAPFGLVENPISMMEAEHDNAGSALRAMRQASKGYSAPSDTCVSYEALYQALAELESDLHQHIHLENNILFPRAKAMANVRRSD
jgi:regulator of cell morphogenesis and NO signaling